MNAFKTESEEYNWLVGGKVKYFNSHETQEELRDDEGQVVPGCFRVAPCPNSDDL